MSARHRQPTATGRTKLSKSERRADGRKDRHTAKVLMGKDPDLVGGKPTVRLHDAPPLIPEPTPALDMAPAEAVKEGKVKHWKQPFWKRRNSERHKKNEILEKLHHDGPEDITLEEIDDTKLRYPAEA